MPRSYKTNLFSKRQYEWLAETIRNLDLQVSAQTGVDSADREVRERIAQEFSRALLGSNPRFDRERFLNACKAK